MKKTETGRDSVLPLFAGVTYDDDLDASRLKGQYKRVWNVMRLGDWLTLSEIQTYIKLQTGVYDSESAISARLRDFRKERFGSHQVERRRRGEAERGLHEYRLTIATETQIAVTEMMTKTARSNGMNGDLEITIK
jgi:hypothetical protein